MTTLRKIAIAAGAGDPDPALALRIDVVAAALKLAEAIEAQIINGNWHVYDHELDIAQSDLHAVVRRYRAACKSRKRGM